MTIQECLKAVDAFVVYKRKLEAQGEDTSGLALQLLGISDRQYDIAIRYYEIVREIYSL